MKSIERQVGRLEQARGVVDARASVVWPRKGGTTARAVQRTRDENGSLEPRILAVPANQPRSTK
jgi:tRNA(Ile2) C34 agmatinyltransferase TiaS